MFKQLEIKDFENHEHTIIDFSDGLNLICGRSNTGKTAIIRALKLVCFNEFSPQSVRVGSNKCCVKLKTDKGFVQVERGPKINEWTVERNGEEPISFSKPGKQILPEVAEVTGLDVINLGERDIKPNIMDQLEGHFLLAEMEGQNVSGSFRAQVIDEISGLAGMESLIKEISLDATRLAKEIKAGEKRIKELSEQKHDESLIDKERETVDKAEAYLKEADDGFDIALEAEQLYDDVNMAKKAVLETEERLKEIPDCEQALSFLDEADGFSKDIEKATEIIESYESSKSELKKTKKALSNIPDTSKVNPLLDDACETYKLANLGDDLISDLIDVCDDVEELEEKTSLNDKNLEELNHLLKEAVEKVDLCPICLKPVHAGCDAHKRQPVTDDKVAKKVRKVLNGAEK